MPIDYLLNDNADEFHGDVDHQRQEPNGQSAEAKGGKRQRNLIFVCAMILAAAFTITICVTAVQTQKQKQEQIVPISEMDTIVEDAYPVETFHIGW